MATTLNGLPGSWDSFIWGMCARRKWLISVDFGRTHIRWILIHNKRREDGSNWRSSPHDSKKIPQMMRKMKNSILEETLIHLKHLDKKWWWSWKESAYERNKDKYSIVISWYCFVMHFFIFSWCIMHDRMFVLMIVYY